MAAQDLCTLDELREFLDWPADDNTQDAKFEALITRASDTIIEEVGRELAPTETATRRFRVLPDSRDENGLYVVSLAPYDAQVDEITAVSLHPETSAPVTLTEGTDWIGDPMPSRDGVYTELRLSPGPGNIIFNSDRTLYFGHALLDVTATWGFPSIPSRAKEACIITVASWVRRDVSQFTLADVGDGQTPSPAPSYGLPPAARRLLSRYTRQLAF